MTTMSTTIAIASSPTHALIVDAMRQRLIEDGHEISDISWPADPGQAVAAVFVATDPPAVPSIVDGLAASATPPRVVLLSSPAAPHERSLTGDQQWFLPAERSLEASDLDWVIVRPVGLMAAAMSWRDDIVSTATVRHPLINAAYPHVHEDDVADVVAACLLTPDHDGQKLMVTGPESVTPIEQTAALSRALDRPLEIEELSDDEARERWRNAGWDEDSIELELALLNDYVDQAPRVRDTVQRVTGGNGRSFRKWAVDHVDDFR
ncbi:NAD(P)H-binding protein [Ilumatobacter sp.]|uniref:NAD(P)H-binding protein n=1 Tax=Ilumatobacter sp. TaxID=1967498 RepID=UPI003B51A8C6